MLFACNGVFDAIVGGYYGKNNLFCVHFCANVHSNKVENNSWRRLEKLPVGRDFSCFVHIFTYLLSLFLLRHE